MPTSAHRFATLLRPTVLLVALLGAAGCSLVRQTVGAYDTGPNGIARPQLRLREALMRDDFTTALTWPEDDELLRELNTGASRYYALQFAGSAAVLDSAALLADDRITRSASKELLSLVSNDMARPYQARRTERLFIPYYGMLSYARLEQWEDAAVEARRLSSLLAQYAADRSDAERATHATLYYLAGCIFERAGAGNDAQVSWRLARAIAPGMIDSVQARPAGDSGILVVVVERGFVAHRATEALNVFIGDSTHPARYGGWDRSHRHNRDGDGDDDDDDKYWLSVSFPSLRRSARVGGEPLVLVDGVGRKGAGHASALIDEAVSSDESRERVELLARATARATAKYVVTKAIKDRKGEAAGKIANIGASLLERADVRSWHLLPQEITLVRVPLASGAHRAEVTLGDARLEVGQVIIRPGATTVAAARVWGEPARKYARR